MKRILSILISTVLVIGTFSGCGTKDSAYSKEEKQIIKEANQMISNEYAVDIDEDEFSYSVGKQISEKEFVPLDSEQKQEAAYENIVSVTALKTSSPEKGEVYEYTVTFNSQTKEVLNISASIG